MPKNKKVVIIEDDDFILKALEIKLGELDIDLISVKDGEKGLKAVKKEKPDLVILDLILPKMHGFEVLKEIKKNKQTEKIPVIVLTNLGKEEVEQKVKDLGALEYILKANTSLEEVFERILGAL